MMGSRRKGGGEEEEEEEEGGWDSVHLRWWVDGWGSWMGGGGGCGRRGGLFTLSLSLAWVGSGQGGHGYRHALFFP